MNEESRNTKADLAELREAIRTLDYNAGEPGRAYDALDNILMQAIELIPGYIDNVGVIMALKICRKDIGSPGGYRSEDDFTFIRNHSLENLSKITHYPF